MPTLDIDAYWCYALVTTIGCGVAVARVNRLLHGYTKMWIITQTWVLLLAYTAIPISLFVFLGAIGAIHDTSVFAAIVVGVAYPLLLTQGGGTVGPVSAPGWLSAWWKAFGDWVNDIARQVGESADQLDRRVSHVVARLAREDPRVFEAFLTTCRVHVDDLPKLKQIMEDVRREVLLLPGSGVSADDAQAGDVGQKTGTDEFEMDIRERTVRAVFMRGLLTNLDDFHDLLRKNRGIGYLRYTWHVRQTKSIVVWGLVLIALASGLWATVHFRPHALAGPDYDLWRLGKADSSTADVQRVQHRLRARLAGKDDGQADEVALRLLEKIPRADFPPDRSRRALSLAVSRIARSESVPHHLMPPLIEALRTDDPDRRALVHETLLDVAERFGLDPGELSQWKPITGESATDLERRIQAWHAIYPTPPSPPPPGKAATAG